MIARVPEFAPKSSDSVRLDFGREIVRRTEFGRDQINSALVSVGFTPSGGWSNERWAQLVVVARPILVAVKVAAWAAGVMYPSAECGR